MGPIGRPETSVNKCQSTRNIPEERRSQIYKVNVYIKLPTKKESLN